ncbi:MAG: sigma-54-dependent Fis family transcriptional regulator, partial [Verrucomicrobia bacterium]|nr:sigma-54-dependent Fis family transcriptional regulator [Verrucomicrobiota bacterium]
VISINLPPLRERSDDIPLLTAHFLQQRINPRTGDHFAITKQAMATLEIHDWPGNIRELENALERACTLCEGDVIELSDLPSTLHKYKAQVTPSTEIDGKIHAPTPAARSAQADIGRQTTNSLSNSTQAPNHIPNSLKSFMRYQETLYIKKVLAQTNGDKERAADILGISLATLYRKMSEQDD